MLLLLLVRGGIGILLWIMLLSYCREGLESANIVFRPGIDVNLINGSFLARRRHAVLAQEANNLSNVILILCCLFMLL